MTNQRHGRTAYIQQCECFSLGLRGGGVVGTTNDAVLRWGTTTDPVPSDASITVTDSATLGMSFTLNLPGSYEITMHLTGVVSTSLLGGFSINATAGALTGNPAVDTDGVFAVAGPNTAPAATTMSMDLHTSLRVEPGEVGAILRTHATDNAGGTPAAALTAATCWLRIIRTHDAG